MKWRHGIIVFAAGLVAQPVIGNLVPVLGNHCDYLLCLLVIAVLIMDEPVVPFVCCSVAGMIFDIAYGMYTGPTTISLALTAMLVLLIKKIVNKEVFFNSIITMLVCTFVYKCIYWFIYYCLGSPYTLGYALAHIPYNLLFNSIFALILFFIFSRKYIKHSHVRYQ